MTAITTEHELLTVAEAADRLRVTTRFIRMLIADGTLPAMRVGKRALRLRRDDVDHVLRPIERWSDGLRMRPRGRSL
jgi:excisionase family DNA binding protein